MFAELLVISCLNDINWRNHNKQNYKSIHRFLSEVQRQKEIVLIILKKETTPITIGERGKSSSKFLLVYLAIHFNWHHQVFTAGQGFGHKAEKGRFVRMFSEGKGLLDTCPDSLTK